MKTPQITNIHGRQIFDSRGNPTVEAEITLSDGTIARAAVPSGASTGAKEACELRDGGNSYMGKGVSKAVKFINHEINDALCGFEAYNQAHFDRVLIALDKSENKARFGANAILAASLALAHAAAKSLHLPLYQYLGDIRANVLPVPMMNIINGGAHADNAIDIQEFMIAPIGAKNFAEAMRYGCEIFHHLKELLKKDGHNVNVGDEGGFAPALSGADEALQYITRAIEKAGLKAGDDVKIALDCAANEFYHDGKYHIDKEKLSASDMVAYLQKLAAKYPIYSIEDPLAEDDLQGWKEITAKMGNVVQLVGDDLFVTNPKILREGIDGGLANALLVKPNQIGTLSETMEAIAIAQKAGYGCILSHRSGETEDVTIAHIAVATNAGQIKTGSMSRSDRMAKYNELLRINEALGNNAIYGVFSPIKS